MSILGFMAGKINPNDCAVCIFPSLLMPAFLVLAALFAVCLIFLKSHNYLIPLFAILINFQFVIANVSFGGLLNNNKKPSASSVKIATYNVHGFDLSSFQIPICNIADFMQKNEVDILCIQEYKLHNLYNEQEIRSIFGYFEEETPKNNGSQVSELKIFSKIPILSSGGIEIPNSPNGAVWADILLANKDTVRIINVHLQTSGLKKRTYLGFSETKRRLTENSKMRAMQVLLIKQLIDSTRYPIILAGDFNDLPSSFTFKTLRRDLNDSFIQGGIGLAGTFPSKFPFMRIDNILNSKHFKCNYYSSQITDWSDHNPVIAELELKNIR
jgi:endonuclease/exonuclease/phosphatase family metal-dependent hydrolase